MVYYLKEYRYACHEMLIPLQVVWTLIEVDSRVCGPETVDIAISGNVITGNLVVISLFYNVFRNPLQISFGNQSIMIS